MYESRLPTPPLDRHALREVFRTLTSMNDPFCRVHDPSGVPRRMPGVERAWSRHEYNSTVPLEDRPETPEENQAWQDFVLLLRRSSEEQLSLADHLRGLLVDRDYGSQRAIDSIVPNERFL